MRLDTTVCIAPDTQHCCVVQGTAVMPGAGMLHMAFDCVDSQAAAHGASVVLVSTTLVAPMRMDDGEPSVHCTWLLPALTCHVDRRD